MSSDLTVKFLSKTASNTEGVVIFSQDGNSSSLVAWQVLKGLTEAVFAYPHEVQVGASYRFGGETLMLGPSPAPMGSTWYITQESPTDIPVLAEVKGLPSNPGGAVIVKNITPFSWPGQEFDIGLYKERRMFAVSENIRGGKEASFIPPTKLSFAVAKSDIKIGQVFNYADIESGTTFDLSFYPEGIAVTLTAPIVGEGQFIGKKLE